MKNIKYLDKSIDRMNKNGKNDDTNAKTYETVTIVLDENIENIINSIIDRDCKLFLNSYDYTTDYMKKIGVIGDALSRGIESIQNSLDEESSKQKSRVLHQEKKDRSHLKVVVRNN